jgi:hypothetical protein
LIDADTGFGEPMSAARTVTVLEDARLDTYTPSNPISATSLATSGEKAPGNRCS